MPETKRRVAVTGATGFIGGHLVQALKDAAFEPRILSRRRVAGGLPEGTEVVTGSLGDEDSLSELVAGADAVVHCAGLIKGVDRRALQEVNVAGTRLLAQVAARQAVPPRFVFLSSLAARHPQVSGYAASKRAAEEELSRFGPGLPWTILRPPAVYGPGDRESLQFFSFMRRGIFPVPRVRDARVSLIYVGDLCDALAALLRAEDTQGRVFEVSGPALEGHSWQALAAAGSRVLGRPVSCLAVPRFVMQGIAIGSDMIARLTGRTPSLTRDKVGELYHADWVCNADALSTATGWQPKIDLDEGMSRTLRWYKDNGWL